MIKLLWLILPFALFAKEITLEFLKSKPRSTARDYYIWRYLDQNITPVQAQHALTLAKRVNKKILLRYAKKIEDNATKRAVLCLYKPISQLIKEDNTCLAAGMNIAKASLLQTKKRIALFKRLTGFSIQQDLKFMLTDNPFGVLHNNPQKFLEIFLSSSSKYRKRYFNRAYSKEFLKKLSQYPAFNAFATTAIFEEHNKIVFSLIRFSPQYFNAKSAFYIGLAAFKRGYPHIAQSFLQRSLAKAYFKKDRDKALFWLYKITKKEIFLNKLLKSKDLNIYTLLASYITGNKYTNFYTPQLKGKKKIKLKDPFVWLAIKKRINSEDLTKLKKEFSYRNTQNVYAIIDEKLSSYTRHPFILPYEKYLQDQNTSQKALIYAIAKQESRFIPSAISSSYALGAMQFLPFLAKHIAKKQKIKNFDLDMMFDEKIALTFAKHHLHYLQSYLYHPLLVAYAYNGGIGYTKRSVIKIFHKYEPLMAMEMIPSNENREYGKNVLANYIIYMKIFGKNLNLPHIVQMLQRPEDSCGF
ncbi:lytic transglycosylase domain-containing protein [Nitratiruptor tergarcus]|uniref:Soluble lytic murein transglycosylase n=1 Tax=Nitratiruptor tergarcus DSM 16512 TaxID=1069081 RepID=A0A1W1WTQ9_9BACT|nr:lytic transglycosylase domain-containing protein [Nitratiruptor tergarcus]SMC09575.1 soluble lytic murein transglycosylase [Nitratiruptor tergarcus DSM 16512]